MPEIHPIAIGSVERFLNGARYIASPPQPVEPDGPTTFSTPGDVANAFGRIVMVDIIRPRDLVALTATFYGATLATIDDDDTIVVVKNEPVAHLAIDYPYQHGHEFATFETAAKPTPAANPSDPNAAPVTATVPADASGNQPVPPVHYRPARTSRLVFEIADDDVIEFTTAGILRAMSSLRPVLHRLVDDDAEAPDGTPPVARAKVRQLKRRPPLQGGADLSSPPTDRETAIEAPFRLVISPNRTGRWEHAVTPVPASDSSRHVELWHSRLGRVPDADAADPQPRRPGVVRAIWARDRDSFGQPDWAVPTPPGLSTPDLADDLPFRGSLNRADRHMLVRQTAETWPGRSAAIPPLPVRADKLWLSTLGAWLDLHGAWNSGPYSDAGYPSILSWDHIAPLGRDQYVRVMYPGFLFPFRHRTALVKITERKMKRASPSVAALYQRKFLVIDEPIRDYPQRGFPFQRVSIRPLVSPNLDDPGAAQDTFFWPRVAGGDLRFTIDAIDRDGGTSTFATPLMWVAEHYATNNAAAIDSAYDADARRVIDLHGQTVAFAPSTADGPASAVTDRIRLRGQAAKGAVTPILSSADVSIDAVKRMTGIGSTTIAYNPSYVDSGPNDGQIWAVVLTSGSAAFRPAQAIGGAAPDTEAPLPALDFGTKPSNSSDKAGGFLTPSLPIRGLSNLTGPVGDVAGMQTLDFNPLDFLAGALPRLFGIVSIADIVKALAGDEVPKMPSIVSEALEPAQQFLADVKHLRSQLEKAAQAVDDGAVQAAIEAIEGKIQDVVDAIDDLFTSLATSDAATIKNAVQTQLTALQTELTKLRTTVGDRSPFLRDSLTSIIDGVEEAIGVGKVIDRIVDAVQKIQDLAKEGRFRFEWTPEMITEWPAGSPILTMPDNALSLLVDGKVAGGGTPKVTARAELRDFTLILLPGEPLMIVPFEHIAFIAGSTGKAEVDVVLGEIEFVGILSFVQTIKDLIPLDGFSDPPYLDVTPAGLTAGFTLALPSLAIGVFSLTNMSLGADVQVPFLGKSLSVGFNFCTRDRPFTLAVAFIGGGGWFLIRIAPDGLEILELGLEAGATLSVDFGVASGSISAMIGIYLRLESDKGSLTGYFRLRGEVDVLGLISASIELYMELVYRFDTGKMLGRARITVQVEVLMFSASVTIEAERQFAGSNGDPSLEDLVVRDDGTWPDWDDYWGAFDLEGAPA